MSQHRTELALLEGIIRSATDYAIISLDAQTAITTWSPGAEALLGWRADEIIGQSGRLIFTPEDREHGVPEQEMAQALEKGRAEDERWHFRKDGSRFWGSGLMVPMKAGAPPGFVKIMRDRTSERAAELALRRSEERFRVLVENVPQLVWRSRRLGHRTWASPQWVAFTGLSREKSAGRGWVDTIHPGDRDLTAEAWREADRQGELYVEHRMRRASDGEYRWFQTRAKRLKERNGDEEWFGTSTDVHELRRSLERQQVLARELHHRTRNLLGVVNAIAHQTLARSKDLEDFGTHFNDRIAALARVQALVARADGGKVEFGKVVETEVRAHAHDIHERVTINGPRVLLQEKAGETMALAVHELATNAVKYGALKSPAGRLTVTWSLTGNSLVAEWRETGVALSPARARGYGLDLIEVQLPFALGASTVLEFERDGVFCRIELPNEEWEEQ
jgi:PAS domain S-box-containing protein